MANLEENGRVRLLWEADSKSVGHEMPSRQITTWQEIGDVRGNSDHSDDDIFHATETRLPAPRKLNYKEDIPPSEDQLDYLYENDQLDHIEEQIVQEVEKINVRDDRVDSGYEDVVADDRAYQTSPLHDSGLCSSLGDSRSEDFDTNQMTNSYEFLNDPIEDPHYQREEKLVRRKSCPEPAKFTSLELPLQKHHSLAHEHPNESQIQPKNEDEKTKTTGSTLQEITAMTRKISRPLLRKDEAQDLDDDQYNAFNWTLSEVRSPVRETRSISEVRSPVRETRSISDVRSPAREYRSISDVRPPLREANHGYQDAETDLDKFSEITAQTRKATKPTVRELDIKPEKHSHRSVAHVQSPTVPALSPDRERFPFTRSSSSNSTSSLSDSFSPISAVDPCYRCGRQVYSLDKIGPIRRVLFHKQCFRCVECNTVLNLKNYCQNWNDKQDKHIYCKNHQPEQAKAHVGLDDRNINITLNYPKLDRVNSNIRGSEEERAKGLNQRPIRIRGAVATPKLDIVCGGTYGFSYTGGDMPHDAGLTSPLPSMRSPREMSVQEVEPRRVWTRSAINAATLDLTSPSAGRTTHHFYSYGSRAFSQM